MQHETVCAATERIREDDVATSIDIRLMQAVDRIMTFEVHPFRGIAGFEPASKKLRTRGTVDNEGATVSQQLVQDRVWSGDERCHRLKFYESASG